METGLHLGRAQGESANEGPPEDGKRGQVTLCCRCHRDRCADREQRGKQKSPVDVVAAEAHDRGRVSYAGEDERDEDPDRSGLTLSTEVKTERNVYAEDHECDGQPEPIRHGEVEQV